MAPNMSKQVMRKVLMAQEFANKYCDPEKRKKITKREKALGEKAMLERLSSYNW